jgi:excinuclease ABC subunit A
VVEHNLDVIKSADWIIDLGPTGGKDGGYLLYEGTPEGIVLEEKSITGKFLKEKL